jgi:hypothetical protein
MKYAGWQVDGRDFPLALSTGNLWIRNLIIWIDERMKVF